MTTSGGSEEKGILDLGGTQENEGGSGSTGDGDFGECSIAELNSSL